ncbi:putative dihydrofolate synthetase [Lachnellula suecica]|uniref:dihydrofolate synthase n=1 Tax=Lachnellula suecica TaxID=602035 RepID=A0A8T9BZ80_9HELO|nr:putative dihydrofolate synthetase [Lachnellula suecica]
MIELGLARISRLVRQTPQPWRAIHVAGTNGKGSICAYLSAMLHASGVRCGRFTSPHLIDRWDCITINEQVVKESVFCEAEDLIIKRNEAEGIGASEFELLTATAFEVFAREKIEMGVVEVGLGGRLDATNVLQNKAVTIITKMGLDHQSFLGNTIEEIARQKAGIMRAGVPCVLDKSNPPEVRKVVEAYAKEIGTEVILSSTDSSFLDELSQDNFEPHQWQNLACAYTAFHLAYTKSESPLHRLSPAVQNINWPGRLQITDIKSLTGRQEPVLLDGAHNTQSAEALGSYVDSKLRKQGGRVTWVLAASQGKELEGILKHLVHPDDIVAAVLFGPVDGMPWVQPMSAENILAAASASGLNTTQLHDAGADLPDALRWAATAADGGPIVIAGSLYLVSDVLRFVRTANDETPKDHGTFPIRVPTKNDQQPVEHSKEMPLDLLESDFLLAPPTSRSSSKPSEESGGSVRQAMLKEMRVYRNSRVPAPKDHGFIPFSALPEKVQQEMAHLKELSRLPVPAEADPPLSPPISRSTSKTSKTSCEERHGQRFSPYGDVASRIKRRHTSNGSTLKPLPKKSRSDSDSGSGSGSLSDTKSDITPVDVGGTTVPHWFRRMRMGSDPAPLEE